MSLNTAELVNIPAGEFQMGSCTDRDHSPVIQVRLAAFYMDKYEVTNHQYFEFCQETRHRLPAFWGFQNFRSGPDFPHHPVIGVSWQDACDFAAWTGKRLPTEAEWEYAARGGLVGQDYPHGGTLNPTDGNFREANLDGPIAVGSYPPNGFGLHDMLGNVAEWVEDCYVANYFSNRNNAAQPSEEKVPNRPEPVLFRVIRGGGWHSGPYCSRVYFRNALPANWVDFNVGFRCVKNP
jgi:formylglycine-generating enzyme required for sulfatase activity